VTCYSDTSYVFPSHFYLHKTKHHYSSLEFRATTLKMLNITVSGMWCNEGVT